MSACPSAVFWRYGAALALAFTATACSAQAPRDSLSEDSSAKPEPSPAVLAALEAAARHEDHPDSLPAQTDLSGPPMSALQAAFDVRHYALALRVMPATRSIAGDVTVSFVALEPLEAIELDLDPRLAIDGATQDGRSLAVTRGDGRFQVALAAPLARGESAAVTVSYGGKPHIAMAPPWYGGFVWSEIDGVPWFATAVQGDGCDLWWPCKDNYADKPDEGVEVAVAAPRGVKVASIGRLVSMEEGDDGFDTWRWRSRHPYAGYAVAINGGPYERIEQSYVGINGTSYPIEFWALSNNAAKARALVASDVVPDLEFFERMIGPYPWGDEKVGFVETPHLGMEHQTINGYGEQYVRGKHGFDGLLHHELAHEWFGNVMTHASPEDVWLHEGYGAYMQAVYAEETVGRMGYYDLLYGAYVSNEHCLPVVNPEAGDVGEAFDNRDIYTKGTWMLHTLREYIGEEAFWAGTRRLIYATAEPWDLSYPIAFRYRSTDEFTRIMSEEAGEDVSWLVDTYLREAGMPELLSQREGNTLSLRWSVPGERAFPMPVEVSVNGELSILTPGSEPATLAIPAGARVLIDPQSKILRALPIIGDCSEQTDAQIRANIDRFTRMAKDYGWRRD